MNTILSTLTAPWYYGLLLTIGAFLFGRWLQAKTGWRWLNPMAVGMVLIIGLFLAFDLDFGTYNQSAQILTKLLGPATVALAIPLYRQYTLLKENFGAVIAGVAAGVIAHMAACAVLLVVFRMDAAQFATILPKSITTAIGKSLSAEMGGYSAITMATIMLTGQFGAVAAPALLKFFRVTEPLAQGLAIGTASHAAGTSRAVELGDVQGASSSLAIVVTGLLTVLVAPLVMSLAG